MNNIPPKRICRRPPQPIEGRDIFQVIKDYNVKRKKTLELGYAYITEFNLWEWFKTSNLQIITDPTVILLKYAFEKNKLVNNFNEFIEVMYVFQTFAIYGLDEVFNRMSRI